MNEQDQREWPSFGDILSELNSLGQLSSTLAGGSLTDDPAWERTYTGKPKPAPEASPPGDEISLPDHLPPASIDTTPLESSVVEERAVGIFDDQSFDTSALEPLEPPAEIEASLGTVESLETSEIEDDATSADAQPLQVGRSSSADATVSTEPAFDQTAFDETVFDDIAADETDTAAFMAGVDPFTGEIDWSGTGWSSGDGAPADDAAAPLPDWTDSVTDEEPHGGIVFPFTPPMASADTELHVDEPDGASEDMAQSFDSVATADAIENDLQDLFELDQVPEDNDNVVPLHPSSDDHSDAVVGLDTVFDQDANYEPLQEWVGVDPAEIGPKDPWAHMRPTEEETKGGFWANRPKFFGGDERKAKKKGRDGSATDKMNFDEPEETADASASEDSAAIETNPAYPCPACHQPGHVDLEDPLGHKVHLSCGSCEQIWSQAFVDDQDQRSA